MAGYKAVNRGQWSSLALYASSYPWNGLVVHIVVRKHMMNTAEGYIKPLCHHTHLTPTTGVNGLTIDSLYTLCTEDMKMCTKKAKINQAGTRT